MKYSELFYRRESHRIPTGLTITHVSVILKNGTRAIFICPLPPSDDYQLFVYNFKTFACYMLATGFIINPLEKLNVSEEQV